MIIQRVRQLIWRNMIYNTEEAKPYFTILGWVLILAFTGFYFFNLKIAAPSGYENLPLRLIIALFGILLIVYKDWPKSFVSQTPLIFYSILIFSFPFFFSYMLFKNPTSNIWQVNELVGLVLLTFFVDSIIDVFC
ncbi:hypothetical protein NOVO_06335 [Rickettsiales bacterium Ac37b]|nr:hypothetical protein NOVO_06335 [Rickettsiales bacterium Ac37b]